MKEDHRIRCRIIHNTIETDGTYRNERFFQYNHAYYMDEKISRHSEQIITQVLRAGRMGHANLQQLSQRRPEGQRGR